jgi:hypothetical protein
LIHVGETGEGFGFADGAHTRACLKSGVEEPLAKKQRRQYV